MKKYFIVADTHSFYKEMIKALKKKGFDKKNPEHIVISCGDIMDRGKESMKMLNFFSYMLKRNRAILVRGNHEDLFDELINRGHPKYHDYSNGTLSTLAQLCGLSSHHDLYFYLGDDGSTGVDTAIKNYNKKWDTVRSSMVNYYELGDYIFVHGWIPTIEKEPGKNIYDPNWRNSTDAEWKLARWDNGMKMAEMGITEPGKTIVCGHWHASYGNVRKRKEHYKELGYDVDNPNILSRLEYASDDLFLPYTNTGIIALDACTAYTGFCNCMVLTEQEDGTLKEDF